MRPLLYEINTRCWLRQLSDEHAIQITLANIPAGEFEEWLHLGFTHIWLMGVWQISPRSQAFCRRLPHLREAARTLLPDFSEDDITGSPYAIAGYQVSETLGGEAGLGEFRKQLAANGLRLILDFIPNHTGLDHPWLKERPELFVQSPDRRLETFRQDSSGRPVWIAHGKDPYFPAWADTAQLDYRNPATWTAMIKELQSVAWLCDGVRCDMAMLLLNDVFARTWERFPSSSAEGRPPTRPGPAGSERAGSETGGPSEFWAEAISAIRALHPDFLFLAEAYWDLEMRLLRLGFDFAYDKRLTDHLVARRPAEMQRHLFALGQQSLPKLVHFLENHDEARIASELSPEEHRAALLLVLGLPGMPLLHHGQLTGAALRSNIQLGRCPVETPQPEITAFYETLLTTLQKTAVGQGQGELLKPAPAWDGNSTAENIVVVQWQPVPMQFDLVVVNLAPHRSQCYVSLAIEGLAGRDWQMTDLLGQERYQRNGDALHESGLYLDLSAHAAQLFHFAPLPPTTSFALDPRSGER